MITGMKMQQNMAYRCTMKDESNIEINVTFVVFNWEVQHERKKS